MKTLINLIFNSFSPTLNLMCWLVAGCVLPMSAYSYYVVLIVSYIIAFSPTKDRLQSDKMNNYYQEHAGFGSLTSMTSGICHSESHSLAAL